MPKVTNSQKDPSGNDVGANTPSMEAMINKNKDPNQNMENRQIFEKTEESENISNDNTFSYAIALLIGGIHIVLAVLEPIEKQRWLGSWLPWTVLAIHATLFFKELFRCGKPGFWIQFFGSLVGIAFVVLRIVHRHIEDVETERPRLRHAIFALLYILFVLYIIKISLLIRKKVC